MLECTSTAALLRRPCAGDLICSAGCGWLTATAAQAMVATIESIVQRGHGYDVDGDVFFDVRSLPGYGRLSGLPQVRTLQRSPAALPRILSIVRPHWAGRQRGPWPLPGAELAAGWAGRVGCQLPGRSGTAALCQSVPLSPGPPAGHAAGSGPPCKPFTASRTPDWAGLDTLLGGLVLSCRMQLEGPRAGQHLAEPARQASCLRLLVAWPSWLDRSHVLVLTCRRESSSRRAPRRGSAWRRTHASAARQTLRCGRSPRRGSPGGAAPGGRAAPGGTSSAAPWSGRTWGPSSTSTAAAGAGHWSSVRPAAGLDWCICGAPGAGSCTRNVWDP